MNWYQKFLKWFIARPRWQQIAYIVLFSVVLVAGFWLTDFSYTGTADSTLNSTSWILGAVLKFGIVLLFIYVAAIVFKKWQTGSIKNSTRRMKVLESTALSPKRALYLVEVDGQVYMIGATDQAVNLIAEVDSVVALESVAPHNFAEEFFKAGDKLDHFQEK